MLQNRALFRVYVNDCHYDRISGKAFLCINDQPWTFGINTPSSPFVGKKIFINKSYQICDKTELIIARLSCIILSIMSISLLFIEQGRRH